MRLSSVANAGFIRKAAGLTQKELSEKLQISQPLISKWEQGKQVPRSMKLKIRKLLTLTFKHLDDIELCGSKEECRNWLRYLKVFQQHLSEGPAYLDELDQLGVTIVFFSLCEVGFAVPPASTVPSDDEIKEFFASGVDESFPVVYANPGDELFFRPKGVLNEFLLRHDNFRAELNRISARNEITAISDDFLGNKITFYIWLDIFTDYRTGGHTVIEHPSLQHLTKNIDLDALKKLATGVEELAEKAWTEAYSKSVNKLTESINLPSWLPYDLLRTAKYDIGGRRFDWVPRHLKRGISPDPFIRQLQKDNDLIKQKLDALIRHFGIADPTVIRDSQ